MVAILDFWLTEHLNILQRVIYRTFVSNKTITLMKIFEISAKQKAKFEPAILSEPGDKSPGANPYWKPCSPSIQF